MSREKHQRPESEEASARAEAVERLLRAHNIGVDPDGDITTVAWRRKSQVNDAAFRHVAQAWDDAARLKDRPAYADLLGTPTLRERMVAFIRGLSDGRYALAPASRWAFAAMLAVMIVASGWMLTRNGAEPVYATQIAEVRDVPLDDGSVVTLGGRSALDVDFTPAERKVRLARGEAFFSVSPDIARPFVVLAGDTRIRVVGTQFNVHYEGARVRVSVLEGVVEVMRADGSAERVTPDAAPAAPARLTAGQQLVAVPTGPLGAPEPAHGLPGGWREGRLDYQDAPLSEIVADANRYHIGEIRIESPALANERLTTSFRTTQIDEMLETLPDTLPVVVHRHSDGTIELRSRSSSSR